MLELENLVLCCASLGANLSNFRNQLLVLHFSPRRWRWMMQP
ncbi:hypothetical protein Golob_014925 [Gossypium lobatum]|uniref:Uncharacterized protein n=1 Tax=Gossypium lobatum TaxID=34289 RepID=A0A7J8LZR6_9ROSI|nr:hypothetical protein [Gossypium lobatum]